MSNDISEVEKVVDLFGESDRESEEVEEIDKNAMEEEAFMELELISYRQFNSK